MRRRAAQRGRRARASRSRRARAPSCRPERECRLRTGMRAASHARAQSDVAGAKKNVVHKSPTASRRACASCQARSRDQQRQAAQRTLPWMSSMTRRGSSAVTQRRYADERAIRAPQLRGGAAHVMFDASRPIGRARRTPPRRPAASPRVAPASLASTARTRSRAIGQRRSYVNPDARRLRRSRSERTRSRLPALPAQRRPRRMRVGSDHGSANLRRRDAAANASMRSSARAASAARRSRASRGSACPAAARTTSR